MKQNSVINRVFTNADQEVVEYDGSEVSWRVSAYVLIVKDNKILLIKNENEKPFDIPGGAIEIGESIQEAIEREAMEEAGAKIKIGSLVHVVQDWFKHSSGKYYQALQLFYTAELASDLVKPTAGTTEIVKFVPIKELSKYSLPKTVNSATSRVYRTARGVDKITLNVA